MTEEIREQNPDVVYTITDLEIAKTRVSQCSKGRHAWRKLDDTTLGCSKCPTMIIIDAERMGDYVTEENVE